MDIQSLISHSLALVFMCLFGAAGISKLMPTNKHYYTQVMESYGIKLPELSRILLYLTATTEMMAGVLIVLPPLRIVGVGLVIGLLLLYLSLMTRQLLQGKADMDCGCNGPGQQTSISPALIVRNSILLVLAALTAFLTLTLITPLQVWGEWLLAVPLAGCLFLVYLSCDQLIANGQQVQKLKAVMNG